MKPYFVCPNLLLMLILALSALGSSPAYSLPPGRAWTARQAFTIPGHTWVAPMWMDTDDQGIPVVFAASVGGVGQDFHFLKWTDVAWTVPWTAGFATGLLWPSISPPGSFGLLWKSPDGVDTPQGVKSYLISSSFAQATLGPLDTLGLIHGSSSIYSLTASTSRRWAAFYDYFDLRLMYSDTLGEWNEIEVPGSNDGGVAAGAVDDTTTIVVWAGFDDGLRWGTARGTTWTEGTPLYPNDRLAGAPRLRRRPSGGHWLTWGTQRSQVNFLELRTYRDGSWSEAESLLCAYTQPGGYSPTSPDLSRDGGEYPAAVWIAVNNQTGAETFCVCMPTDNGFTLADNLPYTGLSTIARDRNGDVWLAWWDFGEGMYWLHTYTSATSGSPMVSAVGGNRTVSWFLSETAPGSWWAVLRAQDDGPYEVATRLKASGGTKMLWSDTSPQTGVLRYRIRRESTDNNYVWESTETTVPVGVEPTLPTTPGLRLIPLSSNPSGSVIRFEILNAKAGTLTLEVYDVRGALVLTRQFPASGSSRDTIELDTSSARGDRGSGLYFIRASDSSRQVSPSAKLVLLDK